MSSSFEDVKSACFGEKTVTQVYYGEHPSHDRLSNILSPIGTIIKKGRDPATDATAMVSLGLRPVLRVLYEFRFAYDAMPEMVVPQAHAIHRGVKSEYQVWFFDELTHLTAMAHIQHYLLDRRCHTRRTEDGPVMAYAIRPGERLATFTTIHTPLPRLMVA